MKKINLRELYPDVYTTDFFVDVTEEVMETIRAAERAEAAYERKMYRYKAQYSLDCENGIENAVLLKPQTPEIIKPLGEMYMEEVTADDIRLALVPLSKKSEGLYNKVNMLLKCIFYTAERNQILEHNPCAGISGKGGKPTKKKEALTDQQVAVLLDTVKGLPPYLFIMLGLYSGLRREEILALQWDCVFLDEDTNIRRLMV